MRFLAALVLGPSILMASTLAAAAPCAGFTDVDSADAFCPNVEWIRNRSVTFGCTATTYCPNSSVTRLSMAAFLNRLGTALTPVRLETVATPGATDLEANAIVCQTADFPVVDFPRHAVLDATFAAIAPADVDFAIVPMIRDAATGTWQAMNNAYFTAHLLSNRWNTVSALGGIDLAVGPAVRFGLGVERVLGAGSADLSDSRCQLRVLIYSRDGTSSPY